MQAYFLVYRGYYGLIRHIDVLPGKIKLQLHKLCTLRYKQLLTHAARMVLARRRG